MTSACQPDPAIDERAAELALNLINSKKGGSSEEHRSADSRSTCLYCSNILPCVTCRERQPEVSSTQRHAATSKSWNSMVEN